MRKPVLLCGLILLLGSALHCTASRPQVVTPDTSSPPLATWQGGQLSAEVFSEKYDPTGKAFEQGGDGLLVAICKAAMMEIYTPLALAANLDEDPEILETIDGWRRRRLAAAWTGARGPSPAVERSEAELRAFYDEHRRELFTSSGSVDADLLFVKCDDGQRPACQERMARYQERLTEGENLAQLIAEEKPLSGDANGSFDFLPLTRLADEIAFAATTTPIGELTPVIETPIGLYLLRIKTRRDPTARPFAQVRRRVVNLLHFRELEAWRQTEVARLRTEVEGGESLSQDELFARAAEAAEMDREPRFVERFEAFRRQQLAYAAMVNDRELMPDDLELARRLAENKPLQEQLERHLVIVAIAEASDDRYSMLATAERLAEELSSTEDSARWLKEETAEIAGVSTHSFGPATLRELGRQHPSLPKVVSELEPGEWSGPVAFSAPSAVADSQRFRPRQGLPHGLAFIALESSELPPVSEIRSVLLDAERQTITGSPQSFLNFLGPRWNLELHLDPHLDAGAPSAGTDES